MISSTWPDWSKRGPYDTLLMSESQALGECLGRFHFGPGLLDNPCDRFHFWSLHPEGANFALVDGSVRFISYSVGDQVMNALASLDGGDVVDPDY